MAGRGRRSKWETHVKPRFLEIGAWCRDGLTEDQICRALGVGLSTFQRYKNDYQELRDVLKRSKEVADIQVEESLFKRAMGYKYQEVTKEAKYNPDTEKFEMVVSKIVTKEISPDVTAQIFWLKNRKPKQWRDRHQTELTGKDGGPIEFQTWVDMIIGEDDDTESQEEETPAKSST